MQSDREYANLRVGFECHSPILKRDGVWAAGGEWGTTSEPDDECDLGLQAVNRRVQRDDGEQRGRELFARNRSCDRGCYRQNRRDDQRVYSDDVIYAVMNHKDPEGFGNP